MKTEERIGLGSFFGLTLVAVPLVLLPLLRRPPQPPPPLAQICGLPGELVMGIPEDDSLCAEDPALIWGAVVLKRFASEIEAASLEPYALPENLRAVILEQNPRRLYLFGHGWLTLYTCERCEKFLNSGGLNLDLVAGRYVHLLSCLTAQDLGHKIIEAGATAFFGYFEYFILVGKVRPGSGRFSEAVLYGDMEIEVLLLGGETNLETIYMGAMQRFTEEITYWEEHWAEESCDGTPVTEQEAQMLINVLIHDRDALRCYYPGGEHPQGELL